MCQILAFMGFIRSDNFLLFWSSFDNIFCSTVTIIFTIGIFVFPVFVYKKLHKNFGHLREKHVREMYGFMYEDLNTECETSMQYNIYFMARRFSIVYIIIVLNDYPFFVCQALMILGTMNLIMLVGYTPYTSGQGIEVFNEACIVIVAHIVNIFLNDTMPAELKVDLGWVLMGVSFVNVLMNLILLGVNSGGDIINDCRRRIVKRKVKKIIDAKLKNRKQLTNLAPGQF